MRVHLETISLFALAVVIGTASAYAQAAPGAEPVLRISALSIGADGQTVASAGGDHPIVPGQTITHYLHAGKAGQEGLCASGSADGSTTTVDTLLKRAAHVWKVTATGVAVEGGGQTFDLAWERYGAQTGSSAVVSRKQRLTLSQDQTFTVDLLHNSDNGCRTGAVIIQLAAGVREDPAFADTLLQYDLWLVRTKASGQKESRHFVAMGKQGAAIPFSFPLLRSEIRKIQPDQYDLEMLTAVSGELRGRVRADGRVSLELNTNRQDRPARRGDRGSGLSRLGEGRKTLEVGWNEPVEIQLPSRTGYSSTVASPASHAAGKRGGGVAGGAAAGDTGTSTGAMPGEALSIQNGRLVVNYAAFFANETVSLIVQVKKPADVGGPAAVNVGSASTRGYAH